MDETEVTEPTPAAEATSPTSVAGSADGAGTDAGPSVDPVSELRAQAAAETKRIAAMRRICAGKFPEIEERGDRPRLVGGPLRAGGAARSADPRRRRSTPSTTP